MRLAKPPLTVAQTATPKAQVTHHVAVIEWLLQQGFNQLIVLGHGGLLPELVN